MSYGVGHRRGSDPTLLWLWRQPVAVDLIRPLAWEPPYAMHVAIEKTKKKKKSFFSKISKCSKYLSKHCFLEILICSFLIFIAFAI